MDFRYITKRIILELSKNVFYISNIFFRNVFKENSLNIDNILNNPRIFPLVYWCWIFFFQSMISESLINFNHVEIQKKFKSFAVLTFFILFSYLKSLRVFIEFKNLSIRSSISFYFYIKYREKISLILHDIGFLSFLILNVRKLRSQFYLYRISIFLLIFIITF